MKSLILRLRSVSFKYFFLIARLPLNGIEKVFATSRAYVYAECYFVKENNVCKDIIDLDDNKRPINISKDSF